LQEKNNIFVHPTAIVDSTARIGKNSKIWHFAQIRENAQLGENCIIGKNVYIGKNVKIGSNVKIQNNASIYHGVTIEDDVFIGPNVVITNDKHPRSFIWNESRVGKTLIKKGASIGANATIVCGITIGKYAMVGAGAVVTKDVPPHALVVGNPAKQIGYVCICGNKLDENFKCPVCKKKINISDNL